MIQLAALLWLVYLLLFIAIDQFVVRVQTPSVQYYAAHALNALLVFALARWTWAQAQLGRAFLPVVISVMSVLPILASDLLTTHFRPGPGGLPPAPTVAPGGMELRLLPVLLMALVLTAWQYGWVQAVLFSLVTGGITVALLLSGDSPPPEAFAGVLVAVIQTISFLTVGYFISFLMSRLRAQQAALTQANAQLTHHAETLESLAASRERNRMARELHDTLAHTLSGLSVQLETVKAYWDVDPPTSHSMLEKSLDATRLGLQETRRALKALRASPLDDLGLGLALRRMAESAVQRAENLQLELTVPEQTPPLAPDVEQCIYRVAQEAVANVLHHANARNLALRLECHDAETSLLVRDDGVGFDPTRNGHPGHFGLTGMKERADLIGADLTLTSQPGQGTTVHLIIHET